MEIPALLFERHPNPMFVFDTDTLEILQVNNSAVEKYGFSESEFAQLTIEDIRPPDAIPQLRKTLENLEGDSNIRELGTYRHRTKDGTILHVQLTTQLFPVENRNARIVHVHDISDTIRLKREVEEAYRDQRQHIDNNPLGMVKYDANFRIIEWSKRAEEKTGFGKDEVLGTSTFDLGLFDENETDSIKEKMHQISLGKIDKARFETVLSLKNGDRMDVLIHASALRDSEGNLKSVLAFIENISDRKEYERQLEQREQKYHRLFEDANDGIFLMKGLTFIDCNERITEIFAGSRDEIIGKSPLDFSPERQPDGVSSEEKTKKKIELVKAGSPQVFEWRFRNLEGRLIDVEIGLNKIDLGEGNYLQAIVRDLTKLKRIEKELEQRQQRLLRAQKLAQLGWWVYENEENNIVWSDLVFGFNEVRKDSFQKSFQSVLQILHPEDRSILKNVVDQARETEQAVDCSFRILDKNNNIKHVNGLLQSEFDSNGELVRMTGFYQDVTDQVKAQKELKHREKLFESLFLNSPVAIAMIDTDGEVKKINSSFESLFGYSQQELIGKDLLKHQLPEERYDEIEGIYKNVFSNDGTSKYYEDRRITKNGEVKDLLVGALPVIIDGEPIGAFGIYTDITKLRSIEKDLKDSLKEKEVLLSEIHHRVKNNLAIISGLLMLEAMNWEDETEVHQVLMQSKLRIHSMAKIHEKLYESDSFANLNLENYITELVETIYDSVQGQENDVKVNLDCDEMELNINQALPCALILNELVTNSFKYAFDGESEGKLKVKFKDEDDSVRIVVEDNGPGLPENFEEMTKESLGHKLVSQLVKQLDGDINVKSGKDLGTCYEVIFQKSSKSGPAASHKFV